MMELEVLRAEIDETDLEISELLSRRMETVCKISEYKRKNGLAVYDSQREKIVTEKYCSTQPDYLRPYYENIVKAITAAARAFEENYLSEKN